MGTGADDRPEEPVPSVREVSVLANGPLESWTSPASPVTSAPRAALA
jgi:hypothetical protein